jgi:tRNA A-37 threonylcarbamoyl transferase component Bud32
MSAGIAKPVPLHPSEIAHFFPQLEILELVGHGGMGMVYKARQPQLDRIVALKILSPALSGEAAFAERFAREAQSLAKLNHSNIVGIYDFGQAGDFYYFLMEYVDGENLHTLIHEDKPELGAIRRIVIEICQALQYAHEEGIIHRDIKPSNILIDKKGRIKIADFGLAKLTGANSGQPALTTVIMGTPHYMAPEQIEKPAAVDHRADLYSLGVVFYEMLTGELPLGRFDPPSTKSDVSNPHLDEVVMRALEKNPAARYQSAGELRAAVESAGLEPRETTAAAATTARPWHLARQIGLMAGTALLAVLLYVGISKHWSAKRPRPSAEAQPVEIDFTGTGETPLLGKRIVSTLQLTRPQIQDISRTIRKYQRDFVQLERQHTEHRRGKGGHVFITIKPFADDIQKLMTRLWTELAGVLTPDQIVAAQKLDFDRFFPTTGRETVNIELWKDASGEEHYVETEKPGQEGSATAPAVRPMPQRYRNYLRPNSAPGEDRSD